MLYTPNSFWSDVDSLKRYLSTTTTWVQTGVMVQSAIRTIASPPSKVRGTCVKSPGPTSRWDPKISSCRPPRSVALACSPNGIMMSAKPFRRSNSSTNAVVLPPWSSRSSANALFPSANMRKYGVTWRSAVSRNRERRYASDCLGSEAPNWNCLKYSARSRACPPSVNHTDPSSVSGMNFRRSQKSSVLPRSTPLSDDQSSLNRPADPI